jgi:hypothetical protein
VISWSELVTFASRNSGKSHCNANLAASGHFTYIYSEPGLPDFQTKNTNFETFWKALNWSILGNYVYSHLVYFLVICSILWLFGTFCEHLGAFFMFWYVVPKKNLATLFGW